MSNLLLPIEERNLSPDQVTALDERRQRGLMLMVISGQFAIISAILLLWVGQDATYAPGAAHPTDYYFAVTIAITVICGITGKVLRRGSPVL